jgi:predicted DNA-binding transcriptional regulator AlpA
MLSYIDAGKDFRFDLRFGKLFPAEKSSGLTSGPNIGTQLSPDPTGRKRRAAICAHWFSSPLARSGMSIESPFILADELNAITLTSDMTRKRMEDRGLFPKRVRIGARKTAHIRTEIAEWCANPDVWVKRHAANGGGAA